MDQQDMHYEDYLVKTANKIPKENTNTKLDIYTINITIKYECSCQILKGNTCTKMLRH